MVTRFSGARPLFSILSLATEVADAHRGIERPMMSDCRPSHTVEPGHHTRFVGEFLELRAQGEFSAADDPPVPVPVPVPVPARKRPIGRASPLLACHALSELLEQPCRLGVDLAGRR